MIHEQDIERVMPDEMADRVYRIWRQAEAKRRLQVRHGLTILIGGALLFAAFLWAVS
jgi:hypothetical protein